MSEMVSGNMTKAMLEETIRQAFYEIYASENGDSSLPELDSSSVLLGSGLDSLGFAILVASLEDRLGYDPFTLSSTAYYPHTFGEFIDFYFSARPQ